LAQARSVVQLRNEARTFSFVFIKRIGFDKASATEQAVLASRTKLVDKMVYANNGLTNGLTNNH